MMQGRDRPPGGWLLLCRPGFETECAAEAVGLAHGQSWGEGLAAKQGEGWVRVGAGILPPAVRNATTRCDLVVARPALRENPRPSAAGTWSGPDAGITLGQMDFQRLAFARQGCWFLDEFVGPLDDPAEPVSRLVEEWCVALPAVVEVLVEAPDGDQCRRLWPACRALQQRLVDSPARKRRRREEPLRLHVVLLNPGTVVVGVSAMVGSSPWPGGIPRLRQAREAPSRSALKLEEALLFFLDGNERERFLRPGMRAVDLGAAPGGWSWELARRGLVVTAVDNGPLGNSALNTGLVDAVRADGFTYRPQRSVDWLVCDMVAPPARVARLVGIWGRKGLCRRAVFNLKLPSGDRLQELRRCTAIIRREIDSGGGGCRLRFKQLYHDREEVTGYLEVDAAPRESSGKRGGVRDEAKTRPAARGRRRRAGRRR